MCVIEHIGQNRQGDGERRGLFRLRAGLFDVAALRLQMEPHLHPIVADVQMEPDTFVDLAEALAERAEADLQFTGKHPVRSPFAADALQFVVQRLYVRGRNARGEGVFLFRADPADERDEDEHAHAHDHGGDENFGNALGQEIVQAGDQRADGGTDA